MALAQPMQADMNWFAVLAHHAGRAPDKPFALFGDETVTYGEMAAQAAALAGGLHEHGVGAGDVVGLLSYNCTEFLETIFAANYQSREELMAAVRAQIESGLPEEMR